MNPIEVLLKSAFDAFRPKMLSLTIISVAFAAIFWLVLFWFAFEWVYDWSTSFLTSVGFDMGVAAGDEFFLFTILKTILLPLTVFGFLWPIVVGTAVFLAGIYVMPPVIRFLELKHFPNLQRQGDAGVTASVLFALKVFLKFLLLWVLTLPLWFIPGVAFILPIFLTAYMLRAAMRFDSLSEHATKNELTLINKRSDLSDWFIAIVCAVLSFIPPILLIVPVLSALAFGRYYLTCLHEIRQSRVIDSI